MKTAVNLLLLMLLPFCNIPASSQKLFTVKSPDNLIEVEVTIGKTIEYSIKHNGDLILDKSAISMVIKNGITYGVNPQLSKSSTKTVNDVIIPHIYKKDKIIDNYNELTLQFKHGYNIIFRAYNDGVAYRFVSTSKKPFIVENEQADFNFPANSKAYVPYVKDKANKEFHEQFHNSFENTYEYINLSEWDASRLAFLPLLVEGVNGKKICITESDLLNYPGMYLNNPDGSNRLKGVFAPYPKKLVRSTGNQLQMQVTERESYIARYNEPVNFPWRVMVISENDSELTDSDMVYKLATPAQEIDYSWIKPGKVAWEWWNDWNLYGGDFEAGINNQTYKYYIDFAFEYGIEYVILDEGWVTNRMSTLMDIIPEINIPEIVRYANSKNVDIILWAGYIPFSSDIEGVCKYFGEMGVKGFKVDFMDRDDQPMVEFYERAAQIALKYRLLIDFHGTFKPAGIQRTYPNVINFEGVHGLETAKWIPPSVDLVTYEVTVPFVRMVAGPLDYTQGAMKNATKENYRPVYSEPMSQGTRCRQLSQYVIFESPLNMLCDSPSNYMKEQECTEFIATVPTTWDETIALDGKVAEYISIARRKGDVWYVGAMTNWDAREQILDLSFLGEGSFSAEVYKDGINAHRAAHDYKKEMINIPANKKLNISMSSGGGFVMKITKK